LHYYEIRKAGNRRERREKKIKKKRETINKQGLLVGLCFIFLHIKSIEKGRRKCRNPLERE
jgi:hypothetical protein